MIRKGMALSLALAAIMLTACGESGSSSSSSGSAADSTSAAASSEAEQESKKSFKDDSGMLADLSEGMPSFFESSNGWTNGSMFNVFWRAENVTFENGKMQLKIDYDPREEQGIPYSGGEFRSKDFYGYGRYEASIKAIKNNGVVTSLFTYTGPTDSNPWDEIDIEILGKDTTKVQFNYFTDSKGNHEYMYDLGFDASEDFHTYAFEWHKDKIVWFVDGKEAYTATENLPSTPSNIMANVWCGKGVDSWLEKFDDSNIPLTGEYEWVKFTPFDE
ncbi:MAG: glycoside hydrolase family 16 protein [Ruminococcus sp.]|nr:glycoside hydrolase family 16 protein [Ruminococcus sp.]